MRRPERTLGGSDKLARCLTASKGDKLGLVATGSVLCYFPLCHKGSCFIFFMFYVMGGWKAQRGCAERRRSVDSPGRCCCLPWERRVDTHITPTPLQPERSLGGGAAIPDSPHNSCLPQASEMCCLPLRRFADGTFMCGPTAQGTCDLFYIWGRDNVRKREGPLLLCLEGDWTDFLSVIFKKGQSHFFPTW